jgi:hypothetical protein
MAEPVLSALYWLQITGQTWRILRVLHIPQGAGRLLKRFGGPSVKSYGFQFFPDRASINKQYESLGNKLEKASAVLAIWPVGTTFFDAQKNTHVVKKLILPNPDSESAKYFFQSVAQNHGRDLIKAATEKARKAGAKVRWSKHFLFNSITLVDHDLPMGWAHVEAVLPHFTTESRPGYTIYKHRSTESVQRLAALFSDLWDDSEDAP